MKLFPIIASDIPPFVYIVAVFALAIIFLFINDRFFRRSRKKKKSAAVIDFGKKLKEPKFEELEKHFGRTFPRDVKALYSDSNEIGRGNFQVIVKSANGKETIWRIAYYQPADLESVMTAFPKENEVFEFANDGSGNGYTIDPMLDNPPVMFYDHETAEWNKVAVSLAEFMAMPRRPQK